MSKSQRASKIFTGHEEYSLQLYSFHGERREKIERERMRVRAAWGEGGRKLPMKFIKRKIIFQVRSCFFCIEKQPPKSPLWECSPRDTQVGDLEENMALLPNTDLQWPEEEPIQSWKMIFIHREMSGKETLLTSNNTA